MTEFHGEMTVQESHAKRESESNRAVDGPGRIVKEFTGIFKIQIEDKTCINIDNTDLIL